MPYQRSRLNWILCYKMTSARKVLELTYRCFLRRVMDFLISDKIHKFSFIFFRLVHISCQYTIVICWSTWHSWLLGYRNQRSRSMVFLRQQKIYCPQFHYYRYCIFILRVQQKNDRQYIFVYVCPSFTLKQIPNILVSLILPKEF